MNPNSLVCNSFDVQYKRIQSLRNQYLTMIRLILKNKSHLAINDIMTYNEIETKLSNITNEISKLNKSIIKNSKDKKIIDDMFSKNNLNNQSNIEEFNTEPNVPDLIMAQTLAAFLPFMIIYYNSIDNSQYQTQSQTQTQPLNNNNYTNNDDVNDIFLNNLSDPHKVSLTLD